MQLVHAVVPLPKSCGSADVYNVHAFDAGLVPILRHTNSGHYKPVARLIKYAATSRLS